MPNLDLSSLSYLLSMDLNTFKALHTIDQNPAEFYYASLAAAADTAELANVEKYAGLAYEVVTDGSINGQLANNFTENFASANSIDFSVGSDARLEMQFELMQADLSARLNKITFGGGTGELTYLETIQVHTVALGAVGL